MNSWKLEKTFASYKDALEYKNTLLHSEEGAMLQIKIKRYSPKNGKELFGVKSRVDPVLKESIKDVEENLSKKTRKKA